MIKTKTIAPKQLNETDNLLVLMLMLSKLYQVLEKDDSSTYLLVLLSARVMYSECTDNEALPSHKLITK